MMKTLVLFAAIGAAMAECPNDCNGHGTCGRDDVCVCHQNWQAADCSERTCQYDIAWVDAPTDVDQAHAYAECSGRGVCNRKDGICECTDGYSGPACQRSVCANDCSEHGVCVSTSGDAWDAGMSSVCQCDPGYGGADCSLRRCPRGDDPLARSLEAVDHDSMYNADGTLAVQLSQLTQDLHVQELCFVGASHSVMLGDADSFVTEQWDIKGQFSITYTDQVGGSFTTNAITLSTSTFVQDIQDELNGLPNDALRTVSVAHVSGSLTDQTTCVSVTFLGESISGVQNPLKVNTERCSAGCQPLSDGVYDSTPYAGEVIATTTISHVDTTNTECSSRGKCDYSSGECECFTGFVGEACEKMLACA